MALGIPLIPSKLAPAFLLAPIFWLYYPTAKSEEIAEAFLGFAAMVWSVDQFWLQSRFKASALALQVAALSGIVIVTGILVHFYYPFGEQVWRMNTMAARDYPNWRMFDQSERLYQYIYAHPDYVLPWSGVNHAKVLIRAGRDDDAVEILVEEASKLANRDLATDVFLERLRQLSVVASTTGRGSGDAVSRALNLSPDRMAAVTVADEQAASMWSRSLSLESRGEICAAMEVLKVASTIAISPEMHRRIRGRVEAMKDRQSRAPSQCGRSGV